MFCVHFMENNVGRSMKIISINLKIMSKHLLFQLNIISTLFNKLF